MDGNPRTNATRYTSSADPLHPGLSMIKSLTQSLIKAALRLHHYRNLRTRLFATVLVGDGCRQGREPLIVCNQPCGCG